MVLSGQCVSFCMYDRLNPGLFISSRISLAVISSSHSSVNQTRWRCRSAAPPPPCATCFTSNSEAIFFFFFFKANLLSSGAFYRFGGRVWTCKPWVQWIVFFSHDCVQTSALMLTRGWRLLLLLLLRCLVCSLQFAVWVIKIIIHINSRWVTMGELIHH